MVVTAYPKSSAGMGVTVLPEYLKQSSYEAYSRPYSAFFLSGCTKQERSPLLARRLVDAWLSFHSILMINEEVSDWAYKQLSEISLMIPGARSLFKTIAFRNLQREEEYRPGG